MAYLWTGSLILGVILGVAMAGNMAVAGFTGAGVPLLLPRLRVDPAVSSAVTIATVTDVASLFFFLGLATLLMSSLVRRGRPSLTLYRLSDRILGASRRKLSQGGKRCRL